ncbi:MAG: hypothetical protein GWM90_23715 [Gemmatimonadetes bacterium]|nr:hypothetical protein [Gemmatimonadota bacterium]NIQ57694.1 hypothetical protein [Gemmatimonadota bacterium]NIU77861.1 hypothetical protein [Gammaproteobacteria bacterium]NIX46977.1 hypothetical protein [Gemmatimonadota bacterium]NIY11335.1 hypothetical protein [Gemmatimonadota bacterium]
MRTWYSPRVWSAFELVFRPWMHRRLAGVHVRGTEKADWLPVMPVLLVANHVSWWDGFLLREVHRRLRPDAPLHVVMSEAELRRFPIFRGMGAVPLATGPMAARSLASELATRVGHRPDAVIGYFPQGRIWPSHRRPLGFHRGAAWLASRLAPVAVVPVGLHLEPLTRPGPAAFVEVGSPFLVRDTVSTAWLERAVTERVDDILGFVQRHGEDSVARWREAA